MELAKDEAFGVEERGKYGNVRRESVPSGKPSSSQRTNRKQWRFLNEKSMGNLDKEFGFYTKTRLYHEING